MSRIITTVLIMTLSLLVQNAYGQKIFEQDNPMSLGVKPGHVVKMDLEKIKDAEKVWMSYMKEVEVKLRKNRKADEFYAEDIDLYSIGMGNTFNLYSRIQEAAGGIELIVWIDLGSNFMTSSDGEGYSGLVRILMEVEKQSRIFKESKNFNVEEVQLKKMEKMLSRLVTEKMKYERNIQKAKELISNNELSIVTNVTDQESMLAEITTQKSKLEVIKKKISGIQAEE